MNKTSLMHSAERPRKRYRDTQKLRYVQRSAEQAIEGVTTRILEHQRRAGVVPRQRDGARRPGSIQFASELILVFESLEAHERVIFCGDKQGRRHAVAGASVEREGARPQRRQRVVRKIHHGAISQDYRSTLSSGTRKCLELLDIQTHGPLSEATIEVQRGANAAGASSNLHLVRTVDPAYGVDGLGQVRGTDQRLLCGGCHIGPRAIRGMRNPDSAAKNG